MNKLTDDNLDKLREDSYTCMNKLTDDNLDKLTEEKG
jgi:hypothetical protein